MTAQILPFPNIRKPLRSDDFTVQNVITHAKAISNADVILMMTPDNPRYCETKLQILAAHYWGRS